MANSAIVRGVKTKIFGVMLIFIVVLDCILAGRGGLQINGFYTYLILSGVFLFIVGTIRRSGAKEGIND